MRGQEFIDRAQAIGRARGVLVNFDRVKGKGSHGVLYFGNRRTVVKDRRKEISASLLSTMIRQLGLSRNDFR